jgi:aminopeptidase N
LVTIEFWDKLWLKEGFAQYYEYFILSKIDVGGRWVDSFYVNVFQWVMEIDANRNIRPMTYYVESPENINNLFDDIAYDKAASVIRTFQNAFGEATWRRSMSYYMTNRRFTSAVSTDLYEEVQTVLNLEQPENNINVTQIMRSWELQSGFPYVHVMRQGNNLVFEQNRFMYSNRNSNNLWWIPISYRVIGNAETDHSTTADFWIPGTKQATLDGSTASRRFTSSDMVLINYQQSGYYRVNYELSMWNELIEVINNPEKLSHIHLMNRAQLIDDSFHLSRGNLLTFDVVMRMMNYLEHETDYLPWVAANRANILLSRWLPGTEVFPHYQEFMRKNVQGIFSRLGVDLIQNEHRVDRYARNIATNIACSVGHDECLVKSNEILRTRASIHPDLANSIYCNGIRTANLELYDTIFQRGVDSSIANVRNAIFSGLGCTHNMEILNTYMTRIIEDETLSFQEKLQFFTSALNVGRSSIEKVLEFISNNDNADKIDFYPKMLTSLLNAISVRIADDPLADIFMRSLQNLENQEKITSHEFLDLYMVVSDAIMFQEGVINHFQYYFGLIQNPPTQPPTPTIAPTVAPTTESTVSTTTTSTTTTDGSSINYASIATILISLIISLRR